MPNILVGVCALLYFGAAVWFALLGKHWWAGVYVTYSAANVFLIMASRELHG